MKAPKTIAPIQLVITYAVVALAWILFSEIAVGVSVGESRARVLFGILKGVVFVVVSAVMLLQLIRMLGRRAERAEQAQQEAEHRAAIALQHSRQLYQTLARANEAALGAASRTELANATCRTLVEDAGMRLAWIGWVEESTQRIDFEASFGPARAAIDRLELSLDPTRPESRGAGAQSIIRKQSIVCNDSWTDPMMAYWRERAKAHGLRSNASVPLFLQDGTRGVITIYAGVTGFFTEEIITLVERLVADLAHGIDLITMRAENARQAESLRLSEQRWRLALDVAGDGAWDWNVQTGEVTFSDRLQSMLGFAPGEFAPNVSEWETRVHPEELPEVRRVLTECLKGQIDVYECEHRLRCKDGSYLCVLDRGRVIERSPDGRALRMIGTHTDVSKRRVAERERKELLDRLTVLSSQVPGVIYQFRVRPDGTSHFPYASAGIREIYGVTPEQVAEDATPVYRAIHPDDVAHVTLSISESARKLTPWSDTYRVNLPEGRTVWVHGQSVPQRLPDGSTLWHGNIHDITERRRAEEDYELLFRSMTEGFVLVEIVTDASGRAVEGRLRRVNPAFATMVGRRTESLVGRAFHDVLPAATEADLAALAKVAETGEPAFFIRETHEGTRTFEVTAFRPARGQVACIFSDVTAQHRARELSALLDAALQAMPAGVFIADRAGRIGWVNKGFVQLTGYSATEAMGLDFRQLIAPSQEAAATAISSAMKRGEVWSGEVEGRRNDGSAHEERIVVAPIPGGDRAAARYVAIMQDVTQEKEMERRLLRAQRMEGVGQLASGMAHDLNNVLAPIMLSLELLRLQAATAEQRRTVEVIATAAQRGAGVVKQVLTFARGIDGERVPLRPRELIRELLLIVEETFPRDIVIRREIPADVPMIAGDSTQLHQVLLNLAVNARDAMPTGGTLTFAVRKAEVHSGHDPFVGEIKGGHYVVLAVTDTGSGMTPEIVERVFSPFFTTKEQGQGTGLGLPTSLGIVRSHGGFIEIDSKVGVGSEFRVFLPALRSATEENSSEQATPVVRGAGCTILVCDDEPAIREVADTILRHSGFEVIHASDGREAVTLFQRQPQSITAVIMDIMMPHMTGDRAAVEMLRLRPDLPILFISGLLESDAVRRALQAVGPQAKLIKKPFVAGELLNQLAAAIEVGRTAAAPAPDA